MSKSQDIIKKIGKYCARNYKSAPIVFSKGSGIYLFDEHNTPYFDFLAGYSAANQGHCHPRLVETIKKQSEKLTITSRACHNEPLAEYSEKICDMMGFNNILPTNTGCEAGETAIKLARAWGYMKKGIPYNKANVLFAENNFWGRSIAACSSSSDPSCYGNYGPYTDGFKIIPYNDPLSLDTALTVNKNICAYMFEPIQGEAGIIIPDNNYIREVREICTKHNVLMIADEVQTGLGRAGKMYACQRSGVKPDILCLGKALSGGMMPVSAVLADKDIMDYILPNTHGSTFGGNPLGSAIASTAIDIIDQENLCQNSEKMGKLFRKSFENYREEYPFIKDVRGVALMNAIEFDNYETANAATILLLKNKIFTKATRENTLRFTPPLTISEEQMKNALFNIHKTFKNLI